MSTRLKKEMLVTRSEDKSNSPAIMPTDPNLNHMDLQSMLRNLRSEKRRENKKGENNQIL